MKRKTTGVTTLNDLTPGAQGVILRIEAEGAVRQRLMDMGIIEGVTVEMVRFAPFGDPIQIRVLNTLLALRRNEARTLIIDHIGVVPVGGRKRHRRRLGRKSKQR